MYLTVIPVGDEAGSLEARRGPTVTVLPTSLPLFLTLLFLNHPTLLALLFMCVHILISVKIAQ